MRREDFQLDGIPDGYQVYDVDLTPSGRPVPVLGHRSDEHAPVFAVLHGVAVNLPDGSVWRHVSGRLLLSPIVRCAGEDRLIVVKRRARTDREMNAWVWNSAGEVEAAFHAGDDVEEVLASDERIVVCYGDEGMTGDVALSKEGLVVLSLQGELLLGHYSRFGPRDSLDVWFHSAARLGREEVVLHADVHRACKLVLLNIGDASQEVLEIPRPLHGADAITGNGDAIFFHGLLPSGYPTPPALAWLTGDLSRDAIEGYIQPFREDHIVGWQRGSGEMRAVGLYPHESVTKHPPLRGLPGGRFIAPHPEGYTILSFE
jgi:hypothetical protein